MGFLKKIFGRTSSPPDGEVDPEVQKFLNLVREADDEEEPLALEDTSVLVGENLSDEGDAAITFTPALRNKHLYCIGKTRTGKTTLLKNLIIQDISVGRGVCYIDPHGDAVLDILGCVGERTDDVIYFDPTLPESPAFNLLALPYDAPKLTEDIISAFHEFFDSWGPRMEFLLRSTLLTLLFDKENEQHTLADLRRILLIPDYRDTIVRRVTQPSLKEFWEHDFPTMPKDAAQPIVNKLSGLLAPASHMERIFSSQENALDFSRIMDNGHVFLCNLSKGQIGEGPSKLLGALIAIGIQQASLARVTRPMNERRPFFFYIDEFQNYCTDSFGTILSEAAKYQLNLILANQNLGQIPTDLQRNIFGNVATIISFQVSAEDSQQLRREMHRSRFLVRPQDSNEFHNVADFVEKKRRLYQWALDDAWAGLSPEEQKELKTNVSSGFQQGIHIANRKKEIRGVLATLDSGTLDPKLLHELFPDYEVRQLTFPDSDDFINLEPHHAFCRMERADNVFPIRGYFPPDPVSEIRECILERMRFAYQARQEELRQRPPRKETSDIPTLPSEEKLTEGATEPRQEQPGVSRNREDEFWE